MWDEENNILEGNLVELQTHLNLMVCEKGSMGEKNIELSNEVVLLKAQVSEYKITLVCMHSTSIPRLFFQLVRIGQERFSTWYIQM